MSVLRRSPFRVNQIQNDPDAFGLRVKEIYACAEALFNERSILISGQRGIGKSSLGSQLQQVLSGDNTLLLRAGIETSFDAHLCLFYACDAGNSLADISLDLLYQLESKSQLLPVTKGWQFKPGFELNLGVFKAKLEAEANTSRRTPATVATQLVLGLTTCLASLRAGTGANIGINIMLDELDQLSGSINFGHFIKIVHEMLMRESSGKVSFIFAGQKGIYSRLITEDPSFERIVIHVPISTLDYDASEYVLDYAAAHAEPRYQLEDQGKELMLSLASGYPYVLHLLGDAAFMVMENPKYMSKSDVLIGLENVLSSDKHEKYSERLKALDDNERALVLALSRFPPDTIPAEIPVDWASEAVAVRNFSNEQFGSTLHSLIQKGHLVLRPDGERISFAEELFRIFVSLTRIEHRARTVQRAEKKLGIALGRRTAAELFELVRDGVLDYWEDLDDFQRHQVGKVYGTLLAQADYSSDWEETVLDDYEL